jgi:arylsulfatase A-like enzyme
VIRVFLAVAAVGYAARLSAADRPNVVVVLVDDLRFDGLGCTGHPFAQTPHADRLAREGAVFTRAFCATPLCSPSRANFLSGQYAHRTGIQGNEDNSALSYKLDTFPQRLQKAGYETAYVGKLHMGNDPKPRPGFDHWVSFKGQGVYLDPPLNINGTDEKRTGYMTDVLSDEAVKFVRKPRGETPFLLFLAHKAVHGPFTPADRHKDLYPAGRYPAPPADDLAGKPALSSTKKPGAKPPKEPAPGAGTMASQMRCLASIDDGLGKLLAALEETKALDDTLVIFTSDNGYFWGDHGLGDKRWAYEPSVRIPFLVRYPKLVKPGTKIDGLTVSLDVAPTALELAGVPVPASVQGKSLVPLMKGQADGWRNELLLEYFVDKQIPTVPAWRAVRSDRWKYVTYPGHPDWDELYDLAADPNELTNRAADPAAAADLAALKASLAKLGPQPGGR